MKKLTALLLSLLVLGTTALAETDLSGYSATNATVQAVHFTDITAPCSGTLASFDLNAGDTVAADQVLFSLLTTDICAAEDGTVTAVFAQEGDDASAVMASYGSLGAMDAAYDQRISCSTTGAYNKDENKILHIGETLYFKSGKSNKEKGSGVVISVKGSSYVVEIRQGTFSAGEKLTLYRDDDYGTKDNVGKGTVVTRDPLTFSGSGIVSQVYVAAGQKVSKGDKLFSLLSADADRNTKPQITAPAAGVIGTVAVTSGQQVWKGELLCRLYLTDQLEITADVDEVDLNGLMTGSLVYVTLDTDASTVLTGQVTEISALGVTRTNAAYYTVHVQVSTAGSMLLGQSASLYLPRK